MGLFTKLDFMNALLSAVLGVILSAIFQPFVAYALDGMDADQKAPLSFNESIVLGEDPVAPPEIPPGGEEEPPAEDPFPEEVKEASGVRIASVKAEGENGEVAHLKIAILNAEHYWPLGRVDVIVGPDNVEENVFQFFNSTGLQREIGKAQDIISIGMASCEIASNEDGEERRAMDRSKQLIRWARQLDALEPATNLYSASLGRYQDPDCEDKDDYETRDQRNALLISVVHKENISSLVQLQNLLRNEIQKENRLGIDFTRYSRPHFELKRRD